jgi:protein gp37
MSATTGIQWTDSTVNFWWGCTKVGPGCDHCYAETLSKRFGEDIWGVGAPRRKIKSAAALIHKLDNDYSEWAADYYCGFLPKHCGSRRRVFIQSMSDLFDLEVPDEWFAEAWGLIRQCNRIEVQIVTKRISAVEKRLGGLEWPSHAGLVVTVVNQDEFDRDVPRLRALKERLNIPWIGISAEPLLGPIHGVEKLDWVIVGGESGPGARPMHPDWARSIRDQCAAAGVPFFMKQMTKKAPIPDDLFVREFPHAR